MIFEHLANGITKHAKLVIVAWIVILLAFAYPMAHVSESFNYDSTDVGGSDTEAMKGMEIANDHFVSLASNGLTQNLIITYDSAQHDAASMITFSDKLTEKLYSYKYIDEAKGGSVTYVPAMIYAYGLDIFTIAYNSDLDSDDIIYDTGDLRDYIAKSINEVCTDLGWNSSDFQTYVTGTAAMSYDMMESTSSDMAIVDPIAIFMIIVLVGLYFRSFVTSGAAPTVIGVALVIVLGLVYFIGQVISIDSSTQMMLIVSMLGAGCDYCIFILSRYREERRSGKDHIEACRQAIMWAGESVATSGMAVMIGFGAMSICSFSMVSNMGIVLALGILVAIFAALTLMSSVLTLVGDRLFWPTGPASPKLEKGYVKKFGILATKYFNVSTRFSIKHAKAIVLAAVLFTVPMGYVFVTADSSYDMIGAMMNGESKDGMDIMQEYLGGGTVMPNDVVFETSGSLGTVTYITIDSETTYGKLQWTSDGEYLNRVQSSLTSYADAIAANEYIMSASAFDFSQTWDNLTTTSGVDTADSVDVALNKISEHHPTDTATVNNIRALLTDDAKATIQAANPGMTWTAGDSTVEGLMDWFFYCATATLGTTDNGDGTAAVNYAMIIVRTKEMALSDNSIQAVSDTTKLVHELADSNTDFAGIWYTGTTAVMVDLSEDIGGEFIKIEIVASILIIIMLFFVMKSYFTPIRSILTILMSVVWAVAMTHLVFGNILGQGVLWLIPIMLLVICLGLGMDYDILLTTRIKEYHQNKGMTNDEAIEQAVLHSGSIITICGIIMGGTFGSLMLASTSMLQQMGFALCFAILVDALVVRTYIVPAAMHLMGEWNWKGPAFFHRKKEQN